MQIGVVHQGSAPSAPEDGGRSGYREDPGLYLVDLFAGYDWSRYSFELFATNVFDKRNQLSRFTVCGLCGMLENVAGDPTNLTRPASFRARRGRSASGWERSSSDRGPALVGFATSSALVALARAVAGDAAVRRRAARPADLRSALCRASAARWRLRAHVLTAFGEPTVLVAAGFAAAAWLWWTRARRSWRSSCSLVMLDRPRARRSCRSMRSRGCGRTLEPHLVVVKTSSFPSGHATSSMIFYLTLALALTAGQRWHRPAAARRDPAVAPDRHSAGSCSASIGRAT